MNTKERRIVEARPRSSVDSADMRTSSGHGGLSAAVQKATSQEMN